MKKSAAHTPGSLVLSWRIGMLLYESDMAFKHLCAFLARHRPVVDEIAFFESITHHLYLPLDEIRKRARILERRIRALKKAGIPSVGINVLATLGHLDEARDFVRKLPFQPMIGHDGAASTGCACPNTPGLREYIRKKYTAYARAKPDFIWVDDDLRMQHHGVPWPCFCPTCLKLFSQTAGRKRGREELVKELNSPGGAQLREAWVEHNARSLESILAHIEKTIHEVDPGIATGLMTAGAGWTTYSGMAFDRWFPALKAVKARPGGGFYKDERPIEMFQKTIDVGRQRAALPPTVTEIQYELENFPYISLSKSRRSLIDECTLALGFGLNGIAFNALGAVGDRGLGVREPIMRAVRDARPFWEAFVAHARGLPTAGLWSAWHTRMMGRQLVRKGEGWLGKDRSGHMMRPDQLGPIGLPLSVDRPGCGVILASRVAETFDEAELRGMLSGPVLMDNLALEVLTERGLGGLTGVRIARHFNNGVMERFTDDPLNGEHRGAGRDVRIEFWGDARGLADMLEPLDKGVRFLSNLETYFGQRLGPCMSAWENPLGGRVVVMGYAPWMYLGSEAKRTQLLNVADWATRRAMPVRIEETLPLVPVVRMAGDRSRGAILFLNAGLDAVEEATVRVRAPAARARLVAPGSVPRTVKTTSGKDGWTVTLRDIGPWRVFALLFGK